MNIIQKKIKINHHTKDPDHAKRTDLQPARTSRALDDPPTVTCNDNGTKRSHKMHIFSSAA